MSDTPQGANSAPAAQAPTPRDLRRHGAATTARDALFLAVCALALAACGRKAPRSAPPPDVLVTDVRQEDVPIYDDFVGMLDGSVNASIQARVQGYLIAQSYREGSEVKAGDLLFQIDPRPFEAALAEAKALLAQAEANARQAAMVAERYVGLARQDAVSEQERDNAVQQAEATRANVEAQRAAVAQAKLNLQYTAVRSPIDGIAGLVKAQVRRPRGIERPSSMPSGRWRTRLRRCATSPTRRATSSKRRQPPSVRGNSR